MPPAVEQASTFSVTPSASNAAPESNPRFVFPMQSEVSETNTSLQGSHFTPTSGTRRSADRSRPQRLSFNVLPAFDFNPSGSSNTTRGSPGRSPSTNVAPYLDRSKSGHRRNGSEFIGGDGKDGGGTTISTSPTKGDGVRPPPAASHSGPSSGRRGHAHRRSGAVSSHDLSDILKPSLEPRGSSLPATPSDPKEESTFSPILARSTSQPEVGSSVNAPPSNISSVKNRAVGAQSRTRVGFSDTVEFIPRPLSTISSDTSSSLSTIRASHSVTGSITSIADTGTSSSPLSRWRRSSTESAGEQEDIRSTSRTAEPSALNVQQSVVDLEDDMDARRSPPVSEPTDEAIRPAEPSVPQNHADHLTFLHNTASDNSTERGSGGLDQLPPTAFDSLFVSRKATSPGLSRPRSSPEPKVWKKQRKVTSWAGSILPRKTRPQSPTENDFDRVRPASPLRVFAPSGDLSFEDISFDDDTTCVIRDPSHVPTTARESLDPIHLQFGDAGSSDEEAPTVMFDLDAALVSDSDDSVERGFLAARRHMHSSGATGGFSGPGLHYHRRAESAPEMVPIDYHTFGFPRFNSNPRMADVFEEEEEDEESEFGMGHQNGKAVTARCGNQNTAEGDTSIGLGVTVVDADSMKEEVPYARRLRRVADSTPVEDGSGTEGQNKPELIVTSKISETSPRAQDLVEVVEADEEPRVSLVMKSSEDSSLPPALSNNPLFAGPASTPLNDIALPRFSLPYATLETVSSAVSSPDYNRTSFDVPRLHTAHSSINDRATLSSCRAGDHGLSLRGSVDDVPSLISSASTMISAHPPRISSSAYTNSSAERSSSLSAAVPARTRPATAAKRSSLASLSRLVGSSYGVKSKLNIEEHASQEHADKVEKRKGSRISRLMRFWKLKEKTSS